MRPWTMLILLMSLVAAGCGDQAAVPATGLQGGSEASSPLEATATPSSGGVAGDECGNPYYPVVEDAIWAYRVAGEESLATHTMEVASDGSFTLQVNAPEADFEIEGTCTREGIALMNVPGMETTATTSDSSGSLAATGSGGVSLPHDVQVGDAWSQMIRARVNLGGSPMEVTIESEYTATGIETVTVPAGTFEALRVDVYSTLDMGGGEIEFGQSLWYAEGVGTVKSEVEGVGAVELVSYVLP